MAVDFSIAKDGNLTCSVNSCYIHSSYSPVKEAERFCSSHKPDFFPYCIVITSPCLPYCEKYLRKNYPNAKLFAIQLDFSFKDYDSAWDNVFYFCKNDGDSEPEAILIQLRKQLFSFLSSEIGNEENAFSTFFLSWSAGEKAFPLKSSAVWNEIKNYISTTRDILGTRCNFNQRWTKNILRFCLSVTKTATMISGDMPIVITASGSSLKQAIPYILKYRKNIFLISVSSSLDALLFNGIIPDLCISTDGGFWAKKHLSHVPTYSIPLSISAESSIPYEVFLKNKIIPLCYGDGIESIFLKNCGINYLKAFRNGTVSGTAALFGLSLTSSNVFFCGLDLSSSNGFQHIQPNGLERFSCSTDTRISPTSSRLVQAEFSSNSLYVYRNWFSSNSTLLTKRFIRIIDENTAQILPLVNKNFTELDMLADKKAIKPEIVDTDILPIDNRYKQIQRILNQAKKNIQANPLNKDNEIWYSSCALFEFTKLKKYSSIDAIDKQLLDETVFKTIEFIDSLLLTAKRLVSLQKNE